MTRLDVVKEAFGRRNTDKLTHGYAMIYEKVPEDIETIFEIGVWGGASVLAWEDLFPRAVVYGLDKDDVKTTSISIFSPTREHLDHPRIKLIQSDIRDFIPDSLPDLDLVVDDGSHDVAEVLIGWHKLKHLCKGLYVVEDMPLSNVEPLMKELAKDSQVVSAIQTGRSDGDRVVVAQFNRVVEW